MKNQHTLIKGYRDLSEEEIALMNSVKDIGAVLENMIGILEKTKQIDQRWVAIGKTDLQKGCMALVRSIAKPTSF